MPPSPSFFERARFLARVIAGLAPVRDAALLLGVLAIAAAAGAVVLIAGYVAAPTMGAVSTGSAWAGLVAAAVCGGTMALLAVRRTRKRQAAGFSRAARRLGEEKTAVSELRRACRRLAASLDQIVPEVLAEDDAWEQEASAPGAPFGRPDTDRAHRLIERLRRVSRAAAFFGGNDLELRKLALAGPCAEVIEQYRRIADSEQEILYIEDGGSDWLAAPIDRSLFVQALRELLDNVLDHGGDWGRITVTTEPVPGAILLRVRDDGKGLAPDDLSAVLQGRPRGEGGGLGLPLVRAIVEAHGGAFRMESDAGRGTSVSLRFPTHS